MNNWNKLRDLAYQTAKDHGFHDGDESVQHYLCLVITELAEAVEADRKCRRARVDMYEKESTTPQVQQHVDKHKEFCFKMFIKDTVEDELADATIRLLDLAGMIGLDLNTNIHQINSMRISKHNYVNNKQYVKYTNSTFTECVYNIIRELTKIDSKDAVVCAFNKIITLTEFLEIDLARHIELKMEYNNGRSHKHGKKY